MVQKIDSVPSLLFAISTMRPCCGQSMCEAVLISQKPLRTLPFFLRLCVLMLLVWVWPLTQAITLSCLSISRTSVLPSTRGPGSTSPVTSLTMLHDGWWLENTTSLCFEAARRSLIQASWVWLSEPSSPPLALTVSMTTKRTRPRSNV